MRAPAHGRANGPPPVVPAVGRQLGRTVHRKSRPAAGSTRAMCVARACARDGAPTVRTSAGPASGRLYQSHARCARLRTRRRANGPHHGSASRWPAAWPHASESRPAAGSTSDARCARLRTRWAANGLHHGAGRWPAACSIGKAGQRPALPKRCVARCARDVRANGLRGVPAAGRQLGRTMHRAGQRPALPKRCALRAPARDGGPTVHTQSAPGSAGRWSAAWPHDASAKPASGRLYQAMRVARACAHGRHRPAAGSTRAMCVARACARDGPTVGTQSVPTVVPALAGSLAARCGSRPAAGSTRAMRVARAAHATCAPTVRFHGSAGRWPAA